MAHAHVLVPRKLVLVLCCTCAPVVAGMAQDAGAGETLSIPATLRAGVDPVPCMACGIDMRGDDIDVPPGQLPQ